MTFIINRIYKNMVVFASFLITESLNLKLYCSLTYIYFLPQKYSLCVSLVLLIMNWGDVWGWCPGQISVQKLQNSHFFTYFKRIAIEQIHSVWLKEIRGIIRSIFIYCVNFRPCWSNIWPNKCKIIGKINANFVLIWHLTIFSKF